MMRKRSKSSQIVKFSFQKLAKKSKSPRKSKSKVRIPVKKSGELVAYGYSVHESTASRRESLAKAVKKYGPLSVFRKLNVLVIFNSKRHPNLAKKFKSDRDWVGKNYI